MDLLNFKRRLGHFRKSHIGHLHSKQVVNKQRRRRGEGDNWWCLLRSAGQTQGTHLPHKEEEGEED